MDVDGEVSFTWLNHVLSFFNLGPGALHRLCAFLRKA